MRAQRRQQVRVGVGREDESLGVDRPARDREPEAVGALDRPDRSAFVDDRPEAGRHALHLADQLQRVDEGRPRLPPGAPVALRVDPFPGRIAVDPLDPVDAERVRELDLAADPALVGRRRRHPQEAGTHVVAVEALLGNELADRVDGPLHVAVSGECPLATLELDEHVEAEADDGHRERAVAAARTVADDLALEDDHLQRRLRLQQVVGGRHPREAAADDRDVRLDRAGQRRARPIRAVGRVPEPLVGVVGHDADITRLVGAVAQAPTRSAASRSTIALESLVLIRVRQRIRARTANPAPARKAC